MITVIYHLMTKAGRAWNASHLDSGQIVHVVADYEDPFVPGRRCSPERTWSEALCGTKPGRRSIGWGIADAQEPTCPRCAKKLAQLKAVAK